MRAPPVSPEAYRFDDFTLNVERRELRRAGVRLRLVGKPFDVFVYIVRNRERILSGEEIFAAVWAAECPGERTYDPQYVQNALSTIRRALGDNPRSPRYLVTERGRGIRFIGETDAPPPARASHSHTRAGAQTSALIPLFSYVFILFSVFGVSVYVMGTGRPSVRMNVSGFDPLTHTGYTKYSPVLNDGTRLLFTERIDGRYQISQVSALGGEVSSLPTTIRDPYLCDISPDHTKALVRSIAGGFDDYGPLYVQPLSGAAPENLGITAFDASWSPDGLAIAYCKGPGLTIYDLYRRTSRRIARVDGFAWWPRWSPDGHTIRFTVTSPASQTTSIWETAIDGSRASWLFPESSEWTGTACGNWTRDGKFFVFQAVKNGVPSVWSMAEDQGFRRFWRPKPEQVTFGPIGFRGPIPSEDGYRVYARAILFRAEILKVDLRSGRQQSLGHDLLADMISYSPDGRRMAYHMAAPEQSLWTSRIDGSEAVKLISPPTESAFPAWSPDGRRLAISTRRPGEPWRISVVSLADGSIQELLTFGKNALHANWSADSSRILFGLIPSLEMSARDSRLYMVDWRDKKVSVLKDSEGAFTPVWSPDRRYVAALSGETYRLMVFDLARGTRQDLTGFKCGFPVWTADSSSLLFTRAKDATTVLSRLEISTHKITDVALLSGLRLLDRWAGLHPDGSFLIAKDASLQEIYAIRLRMRLSQH